MSEIKKVAVIGAGVMGAGIAAHVANAGVPVILLDVVPKGAANRSQIAEQAIDRLLKSDPAAFMHKDNARLVTAGNIEDHLSLLADCDWIIEAVVEKVEIKHRVYETIDRARRPGSIVSSNTSTIPLSSLIAEASPELREDFLITHFFNPPRYMRLLEVVASETTRPDAVGTIREFAERERRRFRVELERRPSWWAVL